MNKMNRRHALAVSATLSSSFLLSAQHSHADGSQADEDEMVADHVLVNVSDFDRSLKWYTEKLGFTETVRWTVDGLDNTQLAYLKRGDFQIELAAAPKTNKTASLPVAKDFAEHFAHRGITHLCFRVKDVDATLKKLNENGVPTFSPPIDFPPLKCRVGFVQDPDGNVIEFKGPLAGKDEVKGEAVWKK